MKCDVADLSLATEGKRRILWADNDMPVLVGPIAIIVIAAVLLPMAKAKAEKTQLYQHSEAKQIGETTGPGDKEMPNTIRGTATDKLGRPRWNVSIGDTFPKGLWRGVRSDKHGRFTLTDIKPEQKLWIAHSYELRAMGLFTIGENYDGRDIHVILNLKEAEAEGRVIDAEGKSLAKREVELIVRTKEGLTFRSTPLETDKHGYYQARLVPCGAGLTIQARLVEPDESKKEYITKALALSDNQIFIQMPTLVVGNTKTEASGKVKVSDDGRILLSGRVLNEEGEPIPSVEVELNYKWGDHMGFWGKEVMTDEQGRWSRRLPKGHSNLGIRLSHPDHISFHFDQSERTPSPAELHDGSSLMVMKRGLRIRGKVLDHRGEPIENALVAAGRLYSSSDGEIFEDCTTARTFSDGSFSIGGLPAGGRDILVSAVGYAPRVVSIEIEENMKPIQVILTSGRTYIGQVADAAGNPLEGVEITCFEWKLKDRHSLARTGYTNSEGRFKIEDLPDEGTLEFSFSKRKAGLQVFGKQMPSSLSKVDRIVMYKTPVIAGKVIDAETDEPITSFELVSGIGAKESGDSIDWNRYYKQQVNSPEGTFSKKWEGYFITYPFDGVCYFKIVAKGYLPGITPPVKLGEKYEPFVISLSKAEPWRGTVIDPAGNQAAEAEVGWVGPGKKAFVKDGKFDRSGFARQAEIIVEANKNGQFELNPSKDEGLIVAVHKSGYAQIKSSDFKNGSEVKLTGWAKIEGTINLPEAIGKTTSLRIQPVEREIDSDIPSIDWWFDEISVTGNTFSFDYVPSIPLLIGQVVRWELSDAVYLRPEPGQNYKIQIGSGGRTVTGKIVYPTAENVKSSEIEFANPRRVHAIAYRISPQIDVPAEIKDVFQSGFLWLWRGAKNVYERSKTFQKKFLPTIEDNGKFRFDNMPAGKYEFVVNIHAPLRENVSCGRGVLKAVGITQFTIDDGDTTKPTQVPDFKMKLLAHPEIGDIAPLFEAKSFDGKTIRLKDFHGKVVLLDFWATWCGPCVDEIPKLKEIYNAFGEDERFEMIGMSLDWDVEKAKRFIVEKGLKWSQVSLGDMSKSAVVKEYGIGGIPTMILIGPDGKIVAKNLRGGQLKSTVAEVLGKEPDKKTDVNVEIEKH